MLREQLGGELAVAHVQGGVAGQGRQVRVRLVARAAIQGHLGEVYPGEAAVVAAIRQHLGQHLERPLRPARRAPGAGRLEQDLAALLGVFPRFGLERRRFPHRLPHVKNVPAGGNRGDATRRGHPCHCNKSARSFIDSRQYFSLPS
ncbi:hypothetical protein ACFQX7_39130 [Luedemannella flava]